VEITWVLQGWNGEREREREREWERERERERERDDGDDGEKMKRGEEGERDPAKWELHRALHSLDSSIH
jgi:hypothetical protein